jgi:hypothetical protein
VRFIEFDLANELVLAEHLRRMFQPFDNSFEHDSPLTELRRYVFLGKVHVRLRYNCCLAEPIHNPIQLRSNASQFQGKLLPVLSEVMIVNRIRLDDNTFQDFHAGANVKQLRP